MIERKIARDLITLEANSCSLGNFHRKRENIQLGYTVETLIHVGGYVMTPPPRHRCRSHDSSARMEKRPRYKRKQVRGNTFDPGSTRETSQISFYTL